MYYNMAPSTENFKIEQPKLTKRHAKAAIFRLEEYFKYYNIVSTKQKINLALISADDEILEWVQNAHTQPQSWEELISKLNEENKNETLDNIIKNSLRPNEKFSTWIKRVTQIAKEGNISFNIFKATILSRIVKHPKSLIIARSLDNKSTFFHLEQAIKEIEMFESIDRNKKIYAQRRINIKKSRKRRLSKQ